MTTRTTPKLAEQCIVKLQFGTITCAAHVWHGAIKRDSQSHQLCGDNNLRLSTVYGRLRPTNAVSVSLMRLADDTWPEANRLIELSPYPLECHPCIEYKEDMFSSKLAEYRLVGDYNLLHNAE